MSKKQRKSNELDLIPLSLEKFTWKAKDQTLSAEESDLHSHSFDGTYPWLQRLYNDACDVGIAIRSHYTGKVERFHLEKEEKREGDLLSWTFRPVDKNCRVKQVIIFND